jgi:signal peptidase II
MLRFGLIISAVVFALDQFTKWLVLGPGQFSPPGCREVGYNCRFIELTPFFDLQMVWNRGISFGLLRADEGLARWGLVLSSLVIAGFFVWWLRTADRRVTAAALGLVIGGAIGNVIDRIRFGAVADFLDFNGLGFFPWVFNVADAAITCGALLLAFDMIFLSEEPGKGTLWSQLKRRFARPQNGAQGGEGG